MPRSINYWPDNKCAKAFWNQHELPPYRQLLADTIARLDPKPGEHWLDLGCGRGMLSREIWEKSGGTVASVTGLDIAPVNAKAFDKLQATLQPPPRPGQVQFAAADFSHGLRQFPNRQFDGIVSGLAISYAESYSEALGRWTTAAYDCVLAEAVRLLKPGGRFVFSVNVPEPAWVRVAWDVVKGTFGAGRPHRYLLKAWRIYRYGGWLKREARRGRFHYLSADAIRAKLHAAGLCEVTHALSFANQAFIISCRAPASAMTAAA